MLSGDSPHKVFLSSTRVATPKLEDRKAVLAMVSSDGYDLKFASHELRDDEDVVRAAVVQDARAIVYASHECQVRLLEHAR